MAVATAAPAASSGAEILAPRYPAVRLSPVLVEIPQSARPDMRVPARIFADEELWRQVLRDSTLDQLVNVATLPGISRFAYAMPDAHEGYGFPVLSAAAAATRTEPVRLSSPGRET